MPNVEHEFAAGQQYLNAVGSFIQIIRVQTLDHPGLDDNPTPVVIYAFIKADGTLDWNSVFVRHMGLTDTWIPV